MSRSLLILLGLLALALLTLFCCSNHRAAVETDLRSRAVEELAAAGFDELEVSLDGRDLTVSGLAFSADSRRRAVAAADVWGVRTVVDDLRVISRDDLVLEAARNADGRLRLEGIVPGEATRAAVVDAAVEAFGTGRVIDELRVVELPAVDELRGGAIAALPYLYELPEAALEASASRLRLTGTAADDAAAEVALAAIRDAVGSEFEVAMDLEVDLESALPARSCQGVVDRLLLGETIRFQTGSSRIDLRSDPLLERIAGALARCGEARLRITGHTDDQGNDAFNLRLSDQRAAAVKTRLVELGMDPSRAETEGLGETRPQADNSTEEGRARNRRIEFELDREGS